MATEENTSLTAEMVTVAGDEYPTVRVSKNGTVIGTVTFGPTTTTIVLEKAYTNWSRQVVRLARATAGV